MKTLLFLLLVASINADTLWVPPGSPCPAGMIPWQMDCDTGSMKPAYLGHELLFVEPYVGQPLVADPINGDVVLMIRESDGKQVHHRIVAQNKRAVISSGDANSRNDGWSPKSNILFIARQTVRKS